MSSITPKPLLKICFNRIANLLINGTTFVVPENGSYSNAFSFLPPEIVEILIKTVIEIAPASTLTVDNLLQLFTSGRVRNFCMKNCHIQALQAIEIFKGLKICAKDLKSIDLNDITLKYPTREKEIFDVQISLNLDSLLSVCPNLTRLTSSIEFNLKIVRSLPSLKELSIYFKSRNKLSEMLPIVNETFDYNNNLTKFYFFDEKDLLLRSELALVLEYCTNLMDISNNIANSLEFLHKEEFLSGTITRKYNLKKLHLGSANYISNSTIRFESERFVHVASSIAVKIAAITCPEVEDIHIVASDYEAICALDGFKNLSTLHIYWDPKYLNDYRLGLQILLKKIGHQLTFLSFIYIDNVDFQEIGALCPQLKSLQSILASDLRIYKSVEPCFLNLTSIYLIYFGDDYILEDTLAFVLSQSINLKKLYLYGLICLDDILKKVLLKNCFPSLHEVKFLRCKINLETLRNFVSNCKALADVFIHTKHLSRKAARDMVHRINPRIKLNIYTK